MAQRTPQHRTISWHQTRDGRTHGRSRMQIETDICWSSRGEAWQFPRASVAVGCWTLQIAYDIGPTPVAQAAGLGGQKDMWRPRIRGSWPRQGHSKTSEGETETWPYKSSLIKHISGVRLSMPTHKPITIWSKRLALMLRWKLDFLFHSRLLEASFKRPKRHW